MAKDVIIVAPMVGVVITPWCWMKEMVDLLQSRLDRGCAFPGEKIVRLPQRLRHIGGGDDSSKEFTEG